VGAVTVASTPILDPLAIKQIIVVFRPSLEQWHSRLWHPSLLVVAQVVSHFNLPVLDESNKHLVCNACQHAKSHQLPYSVSHHKSQFPLELVFQMYGVQHPFLLGATNIMFLSLMIIASLLGFIC
jgi:hypothetical protein